MATEVIVPVMNELPVPELQQILKKHANKSCQVLVARQHLSESLNNFVFKTTLPSNRL